MNKVLEIFLSKPVTQSDIDLDNYLSGLIFSEEDLFVRKQAIIRSLIQNSIDYLQDEIDFRLLNYRFGVILRLINNNYGNIKTMFKGYPLMAVEVFKLLERVEVKLKEDDKYFKKVVDKQNWFDYYRHSISY